MAVDGYMKCAGEGRGRRKEEDKVGREWGDSKTAVLVYKATHGTAPSYLSQLVHVADLPDRRSLRSARTNRLLVPSVRLSSFGGRAFPVAGPTIWNSLLDNVISSPSLSTFRQRLKTFLIQASFPDNIIDPR